MTEKHEKFQSKSSVVPLAEFEAGNSLARQPNLT
jgi:hypothetical protein